MTTTEREQPILPPKLTVEEADMARVAQRCIVAASRSMTSRLTHPRCAPSRRAHCSAWPTAHASSAWPTDMAGQHARYAALLDACVLFPVAVCDSLMSVAATALVQRQARCHARRGPVRNWQRLAASCGPGVSDRMTTMVGRVDVGLHAVHRRLPVGFFPNNVWSCVAEGTRRHAMKLLRSTLRGSPRM